MAQVLHLEQFRISQEAAKCFDDDLDFCPSLTAKELSEIILASILAQKENQAKQQQRGGSSPVSPTTPAATANPASRAITIVDPNSRAPLFINPKTPGASSSTNGRQGGRYSGSTTPATAGLMGPSESYFNFMPSVGRQQQQQQQVYNNMYGSHAYAFSGQHQQHQHQHQHQQAYSMGMTSPTMSSYSPPRMASRIPIVNPDNGSIVSLPETPSWNQHHFVAVR
ncbi:MAG: hypothetical protein J3R72DRAFT_498604 [Linnemannia gamsii]|nr:MAG: hypothetical protein J3R72DRAFT_498604 [Linnemannia gamsii]